MPVNLRSNRAVLVSIAAIGVPLLGLLALKWYSIDRFEDTADRLLRLASAQLANALERQIRSDFMRTHGALIEQLDHQYVRELDESRVGEFVRALNDEFCFVDGLFIGDARFTSEKISYFPIAADCDTGTRTVSTAARAIVPDPAFRVLLWRQVDFSASILRSVDFGEFGYGGVRYHVLVHPLYATRDRVGFEVFVGFAVSYQRLWDHYIPEVVRLVTEERQAELGLLAAAPVVSVIDATGAEVYRSGRSLLTDYETEIEVPVRFVDTQFLDLRDQPPSPMNQFRIRTGYESGPVAAQIGQESARERWMWAATAFLVIAGLTLTARSTYLEIHLARTTLEFFSRLSHDAKTPLANIRLFAETLKVRPDVSTEVAQEYYEILSSQAQRLSHRIGGSLEFARIDAGVRTYSMEPLDIRRILRSTLDSYGYELTKGGIGHELRVPESEVVVMGSQDGLEQLFGNLIDNAIKYSMPDGVIRVGLVADGEFARVEVTDNGIGIPRQEWRNIFKKFYRVDPAGSRGGSGLGLAIAAHVVRAHKGRIQVSSSPGEGTTFTVRIPLLRESELRRI